MREHCLSPPTEGEDGTVLSCWDVTVSPGVSAPGHWRYCSLSGLVVLIVSHWKPGCVLSRFPVIFTFIFAVHQFAGLKCSLETVRV